jgi:hypothetical protein
MDRAANYEFRVPILLLVAAGFTHRLWIQRFQVGAILAMQRACALNDDKQTCGAGGSMYRASPGRQKRFQSHEVATENESRADCL